MSEKKQNKNDLALFRVEINQKKIRNFNFTVRNTTEERVKKKPCKCWTLGFFPLICCPFDFISLNFLRSYRIDFFRGYKLLHRFN